MRTYDKEFKINTVNLYKSSGKSLKIIAQDLGLATSTLSKWAKEYSENVTESFPGKGYPKASPVRRRILGTKKNFSSQCLKNGCKIKV